MSSWNSVQATNVDALEKVINELESKPNSVDGFQGGINNGTYIVWVRDDDESESYGVDNRQYNEPRIANLLKKNDISIIAFNRSDQVTLVYSNSKKSEIDEELGPALV